MDADSRTHGAAFERMEKTRLVFATILAYFTQIELC